MITQEYDLNLVPGGPLVIVHVSQYDDDSRNIIFSLYSGIKKFDVPISAKVTCNGTKKDNKGFSHEFAFSGNKVTVKPTEDMTAVGGETVCEIVIENNGERLGTANFILMVEDGALGDGTDMSPSDVAQAYDILEKAAKAASDAQEMADHPNFPKNGTWWKWDKESGQYVDTHQRSVLGIDKTYPSFDDMEADKGNQPENTVSIIQSNVDDENNAKLYIHNGSDWVYLADLSGFTGVGIESIELTDGDHSHGTYDTYTITMDNGDTSTFVVWNGETGPRGDSGFSPTVTTKKDGKVTTVTITDADGPHEFDILDGEDGAGAVESVNGQTGVVELTAEDVDAYTKEEIDEKVSDSWVRYGITITFDAAFAGKEYTFTDGADETYTGTVPDGLSVFVNAQKPNTEYTLSCEASNGQTYTGVITTGQYFGLQTYHLATWMASVKVTAVSGASVTVTLNGEAKGSGECGPDGTAAIQVYESGNYQVSATYSGASSDTQTVNVEENGQEYPVTVTFMTISVTTKVGAAITVTEGATTLNGTGAASAVRFYIPRTGTWQVKATADQEEVIGSVRVTAYTNYPITLDFPKVFGVAWDYSNSSSALARLKTADDPNKFVNVDITQEPVPTKNGAGGSSPFDAYMPWKGMEEYNIAADGTTTKSGADGFSRTANDTLVYIPEFWYAVKADGGATKRYFYVADKKKYGFEKHPGSGRYVSRYDIAAGYVTKSNLAPLVSITRATVRTNVMKKGAGWYPYDYATWCAIWILYLVEFANWDSQASVGRGYVDGNSAAIRSGGTDAMTYHTGWPAGTNGKTAVQYRHIENPWGNVTEFCDGVNFNAEKVYVCLDPSKYKDATAEGYTEIGAKHQAEGYIKGVGLSSVMPWAFYPTDVGGSETTYIPDYAYYGTGWGTLVVGHAWANASAAGLFGFGAGAGSSVAGAAWGARLLYIP